jgi:hypothetical protein
MSEFLNCAWIYMIYRKEKEQKDRYYFKLKQLQEKRRRKYDDRRQLEEAHKNLRNSLYEKYFDETQENNFEYLFKIDKIVDEFMKKQNEMSMM